MVMRNKVKELRWVPASELRKNPKNWRRHPDSQRAALHGTVDQIGFTTPLQVRELPDGSLELIDGHLRLEEFGDETLPVVVVDLTEAEAAVALATHDPLAMMAVNDTDSLLALLQETEFDSKVVSELLEAVANGERFPMPDMTQPAGSDAEDPGADIDKADELREKWGVERGQVWEIGPHRLMCGDCLSRSDLGNLMEGNKCDSVFTSPPYGVGIDYGTYQDTIENLRAMLPSMSEIWLEHVEPGGYAVLNFNDIASNREATESDEPCEYPMGMEYWAAFRPEWSLWARRIWCKPTARVHSPWCIQSNRAPTDWEHIWTWKSPGTAIIKRVDGEQRSAIGWVDSSKLGVVDVGKDVHGAGMALGIARWMVNIHVRSHRVVHDPFLGTGTTMVAAEQLGRICYGMEIEPKYVAVTLERMQGMGLEPKLVE
jgi:DNA modification methylase